MNFKKLRLIIAMITLSSINIFGANVTIGNSVAGTHDTSSNSVGQSFQATKTGVISIIRVANGAGTFSGNLKIYSGAGNGGSLLHTQAVTLTGTNPVYSSYSFEDITISASVEITSGFTYTFVFTDGTDQLIYENGASYADGQLYVDAGANPVAAYDMVFEVVQGDAPSSNTAPTITNATASQAVNDNATITPFSTITLADTDGDNLAVTIALDDNAKGTLSSTSIASTNVAAAQTALRAITFNPTDNRVAPASTETTTFTITVNDGTTNSTPNNTTTVISTSVNDAPTDITLSSTSVNQSGGANATVGTLGVTDADTGDSATYTLVAGTDGTNNGSFNISGTSLQANDSGALSAGTYKIRVNVNDGDANFEKAFTITVTDDISSIVNSVSVPNNQTYTTSDNLSFTVNINENVIITGTPRLSLSIGSTTKYATYTSGSGTSALVFTYSVESGLNDSDGISVDSLELNGGTIKDSTGNDMTLTLNSVADMTAILVDSLAPTTTFNPANSVNHPKNNDITITFDEAIRNTNDSEITNANVATLITLKETNSSGSDVAFSATIDGTKKIITINPTNDLTESQTYYVAYANVEDTVENERSSESITFTVEADTTAPTVTTFTPADGSTALVIDGDIVVLFDENIQKGTGDIVLKKYSDESEIEVFNIEISTQITVSGATLTINPTNNLEFNTKYYIEIAATAIKDTATAENTYLGISGKDTWDFTSYAKLSLTNLESTNIAYTESDNATAITALLEVVNPSTEDISGATVTISSGFVSSEDVLGFVTQNGITGSFNSTTGVLTLTGTTTIANYQTALRTITYDNTNDSDPSTTNRVLDIVVTDSVATSVAVQRTIALTAVDNTPDAFTFTALTNQLQSTALESDTVTIAGIENGTAISVANGEYKIGTGAYTTTAGTINDNETITLRQTSSAGYSTKTTTNITIGDTTIAFDVTTKAAPSTGGGGGVTPPVVVTPPVIEPEVPETPVVEEPEPEPETPIVVEPEPTEPETPIDTSIIITDDGIFDEDPTSDDMDLVIVNIVTGEENTEAINITDTGITLESVTATETGYNVELKNSEGETTTQTISFTDADTVVKTVTDQGEELQKTQTIGDTTVSTKVEINNNGTSAVTFVSKNATTTKKAAIVTMKPNVTINSNEDGSIDIEYSTESTEVQAQISSTGSTIHSVKTKDANGEDVETQATSQYDGTIVSLLEDGTVQTKVNEENEDGTQTLISVSSTIDGKATHFLKITKDGVATISKTTSEIAGATTTITEEGQVATQASNASNKGTVITNKDGTNTVVLETENQQLLPTLGEGESFEAGTTAIIEEIDGELQITTQSPLTQQLKF